MGGGKGYPLPVREGLVSFDARRRTSNIEVAEYRERGCHQKYVETEEGLEFTNGEANRPFLHTAPGVLPRARRTREDLDRFSTIRAMT